MDLYLLYLAEKERQEKVQRHRQPAVSPAWPVLPDETFTHKFRLTKQQFNTLCQDLAPILAPIPQSAHRKIQQEVKILASLLFLGSGSYQHCLHSCDLGLSKLSLVNCVNDIIDALNHPQILFKYITFPSKKERQDIVNRFNERFGFPGVLGCVGNTHVGIVKPNVDEEEYYNGEGYYSLNVQVSCTSDLHIFHVDATVGGRSPDARVWTHSQLRPIAAALGQRTEHTYVLGHSGYQQSSYMMTPFYIACHGSPEEYYNNKHEQTYSVLHNCIALLKSRFQCLLAQRSMFFTPTQAGKVVTACVVLHNLMIDSDDHNYSQIDEYTLEMDLKRQPKPQKVIYEHESCSARDDVVRTLWGDNVYDDEM